MAQVLQDVGQMVVNFGRSIGYSLPSFEINQTKVYNSQNPSSNQHYKNNKLHTKKTQQLQPKPDQLKCWQCQGDHLKKIVPLPLAKLRPNILGSKISKKRQCKLFKSFQKKFLNRKESITMVAEASDIDDSEELLNKFFSEFERLMC